MLVFREYLENETHEVFDKIHLFSLCYFVFCSFFFFGGPTSPHPSFYFMVSAFCFGRHPKNAIPVVSEVLGIVCCQNPFSKSIFSCSSFFPFKISSFAFPFFSTAPFQKTLLFMASSFIVSFLFCLFLFLLCFLLSKKLSQTPPFPKTSCFNCLVVLFFFCLVCFLFVLFCKQYVCPSVRGCINVQTTSWFEKCQKIVFLLFPVVVASLKTL